MSRWFRHYAGMMRDDKLVRVAIRSKQTIERVTWIWGAILESAAEIDDDGRFDVDGAEIAYFLRADQADVDAVLHGLAEAGHVAAGCVVKWGVRQFTSDKSAKRVAAYRERKRAEIRGCNDIQTSQNCDVTLQERFCNGPETETETETEDNTPKGVVDAEHQPLTVDEVIEAWNLTAERKGLRKAVKVTPQRRKQIQARIRQNTIDEWREALAAVERSSFCCGENDRGWRADLDFLLQPKSFTRLIEGFYDGAR